ncbi:8-oxo-dGTP pyrophosphatase MutT (NUDIX family) [Sphingobium sp. OAS761]|uniref:NUDIX hydrolase n=1 Tax=Sphingobium sp. OAS761 TaxID=2817901 RepID=UPI00209F6E33|nr:NUDIX domain-containing protein [Sphingobium sp. OAS761]MCP1470536.1 8-oxo-dGTP pyrophosphatase MutT (NUDIX family) [Sphingobium sp. OAS761]
MTQSSTLDRPAATVVIVRDRPGAMPSLLMVQRAPTLAFAAGALVFPGGAVDDADRALALETDHGLPQDEAASRIAAIREAIEEAGIGVGLVGAVDAAALLRLRDGLHDGQPLGALLTRHDIGLALDQLVPFARWHPAPFERATRIFDTRFYLARAPEGQVASVDTTENVRLLWGSAADTLSLCDAGEGRIIFPTRRNLERLAPFASHADMVAHAAAFPVEKIRPWQEERDGETCLCIPDHLGYPVTSEPMRRVQRG